MEPARSRPRRPLPPPPPHPVIPAESIPAPKPVLEVIKERHPHLVLRILSVLLCLAALALGTAALWYHYVELGRTHPIQRIVAEALEAYENGVYDVAREKLLSATRMDVRRKELLALRGQAERWLPMAEAQLALSNDNFDLAFERLRKAENRGVNRAKAAQLWKKIWSKKDLYRLQAEGAEDLAQGRFSEVELKLEEYAEKATAVGLDPSQLKDRLNLSRRDRKYHEALERAKSALAEEKHEEAFRALTEAESIKVTRETRLLREKISSARKQTELLLRGDEAMMERDYEAAAAAYIEANQTKPSSEIENKVRLARAYVLFEEAEKAIARGDLLVGEQRLKNSLWQFPTRQAHSRLKAMESAFESAELARRADRALERGDYAEAKRLYSDALAGLPPAAQALVTQKLKQAERGAAIQRGEQAAKRGDWETAMDAFEQAQDPGRDDELDSRTDGAKANPP